VEVNPRSLTTTLVWHARRDIATGRTTSVVMKVITRSMRGLVKRYKGPVKAPLRNGQQGPGPTPVRPPGE
jgi:hypothetical protein